MLTFPVILEMSFFFSSLALKLFEDSYEICTSSLIWLTSHKKSIGFLFALFPAIYLIKKLGFFLKFFYSPDFAEWTLMVLLNMLFLCPLNLL